MMHLHAAHTLTKFPKTAWILWVETDVSEWAVCAFVVKVRQRVALDRLGLGDLEQTCPPVFEQCGHLFTDLRVNIRAESYNVDVANPVLFALLNEDVERARPHRTQDNESVDVRPLPQ